MLTRTFFHKKSHSSIEPSIFVKDSQLTLPNVVRVWMKPEYFGSFKYIFSIYEFAIFAKKIFTLTS